MPFPLPAVHQIVAVAGVAGSLLLLPVALRRRHVSAGFLAAALIALPPSATITGAMSMPHDRYQSRIMWLPSCVALIAVAGLRRHARIGAEHLSLHVMAGAGPPSCVHECVLSGRCKSTPGGPTVLKSEVTALTARRRGEQPEANRQSVGIRTRFGRADW